MKVTAATPDGTVTKESPFITISGAVANHRDFSFGCEHDNIGGFHLYNLNMRCTALVADRNSQKLGGVAVTFRAEAGAVDQRVVTAGAAGASMGTAAAIYKTQDPQPADVEPGPDEPSRAGPCLVKGAKTCNPRDGVVTIIAVTAGEEAWTDTNQNGKWDQGEPFVDLPEPYVDVNDNGQFDATDPIEKDQYNDANQNGKWDDANKAWDGNTQIWKAAKIIWTGEPALMSFHGSSGGPALSGTLDVPHCGLGKDVFVLIMDGNLNFPATRAGNTLTCSCSNNACKPLAPLTIFGAGAGPGPAYLPFKIDDSHVCSPDCKLATQPCTTLNGAFTCKGLFKPSDDAATAIELLAGPALGISTM